MANNKPGSSGSSSQNRPGRETGTQSGGQRQGSAGGTGGQGSQGTQGSQSWNVEQTQGSSRQSIEQKASQATDRAVDKAQSAFENTKSRITHQFTAMARAMESAAQRLNQEQQTGLGNRVQQYVQKAENASQYLRDKSPRELKNDLDRFARQRPGWFLGVAFVAGLLGARFLKSSESETGTYPTGKDRWQYAGA